MSDITELINKIKELNKKTEVLSVYCINLFYRKISMKMRNIFKEIGLYNIEYKINKDGVNYTPSNIYLMISLDGHDIINYILERLYKKIYDIENIMEEKDIFYENGKIYLNEEKKEKMLMIDELRFINMGKLCEEIEEITELFEEDNEMHYYTDFINGIYWYDKKEWFNIRDYEFYYEDKTILNIEVKELKNILLKEYKICV